MVAKQAKRISTQVGSVARFVIWVIVGRLMFWAITDSVPAEAIDTINPNRWKHHP